MDNSEIPKARRPLPTPGLPVSQLPNAPVLSPSPVPAATFYGPQKPPPLPLRPQNPGSKHTAYVPPRYESPTSNDPSGYREPELVSEDAIPEEDDIVPDLLPATESHWADNTDQDVPNIWPTNDSWQTGGSGSGWDTSWTGGDGNTGTAAEFDYMTSNRIDHDFNIDGRVTYEETRWWNPEIRERNKRPGPGVLAPVLAEELHDSDHSLFSVNVTVPSIAPLPPAPISKDHTGGPSTPSSLNLHYTSVDHSPPTEEEVRTSVPHPNAYYCPKDNGWVILSWKASSVVPPLAKSYITSGDFPLPDQTRRRRVASCIEEGEQPFGKSNKSHHFHKYEKAIDSHKLTPPFRRDEWQALEMVKQKRRVGTIMTTDLNIGAIKADGVDSLGDNDVEVAEEEGKLLDLYMCCQCSFYCVASGVIPGLIPRKYLEELVRDKKGHPTVGKSGEHTAAIALETFLT